MKEYTHEFKTDDVTGYVKVKVPSFKERLAMLKELGIKISGDGGSIGDVGEMGTKAFAKVEELLVDMELTTTDGTVFKKEDLDEFSHYAPFQAFLAEMQELLFQGIKLGK